MNTEVTGSIHTNLLKKNNQRILRYSDLLYHDNMEFRKQNCSSITTVLIHVPSYLFGEPVFYSVLIVNLTEQRSETCYTGRDKSGPALFLQHPELYLLTLSHLLYNKWLVFQNLLTD